MIKKKRAPRKNNNPVSFYLSDEVNDLLGNVAKAEDRAKTMVVTRAIRAYASASQEYQNKTPHPVITTLKIATGK